MRLGFFGNPGNYPLMLARALRCLGHDVVFTLSSEAALDRPENRYKELGPPYPPWFHDFGPLAQVYFGGARRSECVELLSTCDVVVLSHIGPSLAPEIARPAVALLTGSDVIHYADPRAAKQVTEGAPAPEWLQALPRPAQFERLAHAQREGIARAVVVAHFARGLVPEGDRILDGLGVPDSRRVTMLMSETDRIAFAPPPRNARVRTFCAARLNWMRDGAAGHAELDHKGSDVMVRGLGRFLREHGPCLDVRLVRKGAHVAETAALVREEGFAGMVTWLDEMSQEDVLREFREADIVFDQLDRSVVAMAGLDAMATGRPLVANGRPEDTEAAVGAPSPICQARTPGEVAAQLRRLAFDADVRARVGAASRHYVEEHFSAEAAARRLLERLRQALPS